MSYVNHYKFIERHGEEFSNAMKLPYNIAFDLSANGDKASAYDTIYEEMNVSKVKGRMIFLMSYFKPYSSEKDEIGINEWLRKNLSDEEVLNVLSTLEE